MQSRMKTVREKVMDRYLCLYEISGKKTKQKTKKKQAGPFCDAQSMYILWLVILLSILQLSVIKQKPKQLLTNAIRLLSHFKPIVRPKPK